MQIYSHNKPHTDTTDHRENTDHTLSALITHSKAWSYWSNTTTADHTDQTQLLLCNLRTLESRNAAANCRGKSNYDANGLRELWTGLSLASCSSIDPEMAEWNLGNWSVMPNWWWNWIEIWQSRLNWSEHWYLITDMLHQFCINFSQGKFQFPLYETYFHEYEMNMKTPQQ